MKIHPCFTQADREVVHQVMHARRDMRHFLAGGTVPPATLERILQAGHMAPSVGLMQPWRFIRVLDPGTRRQLGEEAERVRMRTAERMGTRKEMFLRLKVEGINECAELLVLVLAPDDGTLVGRFTMEREMAIASCACAIQNMWLAARVENLGLGWVSFFDPEIVGDLLGCPAGAQPLAILCLGPVQAFPPAPLLSLSGWRQGKPLEAISYIDRYGAEPEPPVLC
ncbi:MAG: 5,6-dimethylbenzimidazole synthase [Magnetococcales bacterium]|nr:5,6-dimethylbenzimidazole synthase [Magnetococcales bacterium]